MIWPWQKSRPTAAAAASVIDPDWKDLDGDAASVPVTAFLKANKLSSDVVDNARRALISAIFQPNAVDWASALEVVAAAYVRDGLVADGMVLTRGVDVASKQDPNGLLQTTIRIIVAALAERTPVRVAEQRQRYILYDVLPRVLLPMSSQAEIRTMLTLLYVDQLIRGRSQNSDVWRRWAFERACGPAAKVAADADLQETWRRAAGTWSGLRRDVAELAIRHASSIGDGHAALAAAALDFPMSEPAKAALIRWLFQTSPVAWSSL